MRGFFRHPYVPIVAGLVLLVVAIREWNYKTDHPHAYGPAVHIAVACVAAAVVAFTVAALAWENEDRDADIRKVQAEVWRLRDELRDELDLRLRTLTHNTLELNEIEMEMDLEDLELEEGQGSDEAVLDVLRQHFAESEEAERLDQGAEPTSPEE